MSSILCRCVYIKRHVLSHRSCHGKIALIAYAVRSSKRYAKGNLDKGPGKQTDGTSEEHLSRDTPHMVFDVALFHRYLQVNKQPDGDVLMGSG